MIRKARRNRRGQMGAKAPIQLSKLKRLGVVVMWMRVQ